MSLLTIYLLNKYCHPRKGKFWNYLRYSYFVLFLGYSEREVDSQAPPDLEPVTPRNNSMTGDVSVINYPLKNIILLIWIY